jgi:PadR family transcriptional regulator, regulatory protein AphA
MLGRMSRPTLTTSSYVILGLLQLMTAATPYELEAVISRSGMVTFWWMSHTQIYSECAQLTAAGYLDEQREESGRRRRVYRLTQFGRQAMDDWRAKPPEEPEQTRDPALLKLFFGADPPAIAAAQIDAHRRQLQAFENIVAKIGEGHYGGRGAVIRYALAYERMALDFWTQLAEQAATGEPDTGSELYGGPLFGPL